MFFIIELFSNNLFELFEFVINILDQNNRVTIMHKSEQKERLFISTQYFRLNVYIDNDRKIFDKEDFGVEINTVIWFDVITTSNYAPVIISFLKTLLQKYSGDVVMLNTGYDMLLIRKKSKIIIGNDNLPMVKDIKKEIAENNLE